MQARQSESVNYTTDKSVTSSDHGYSHLTHTAHHRTTRVGGDDQSTASDDLSPRPSVDYASVAEGTPSAVLAGGYGTDNSTGIDINKMSSPGRVSLQIAATPSPKKAGNESVLRWVAMILLVVQTVASISVIRLSMTLASTGQPYIKPTLLLLSEIMKLVASVVLLCVEDGPKGAFYLLYTEVIMKPRQTLVVGVPAFLYMIQNELILHSLQNLSGAVYQVSYQLKILTTALLSVIILNKILSKTKWSALLLLTGSVTLIELQSHGADSATKAQGNPMLGFAAVMSACVTSGFAGVYLEKVLKESKLSIWLRNVQLALLTIILLCISIFIRNREEIQEGGFFQGYNWATFAACILQSLGGMIVAAVLKYADNILKCFGNAVAIVLSCYVSWLMSEFSLSPLFLLATCCVMYSTLQYATDTVYIPYVSTIHQQRRLKHTSDKA